MKKHAFYTLGCRANQYQTETIKSRITNHESRIVDFAEIADTYVINTCTVTEDADRKSRQAIRRAIRQNPKAKIIITGCYAKLEGEKLKQLFPNIILTPPSPLSIFDGEGGKTFAPAGVRIRANLMIQDGCEHFCSYCIVPFARGKLKFKAQADVIAEAKQLAKAGAREIVLTGINLGTYRNLSLLVARLSSLDNLLRIRLSSIEPMYLTKGLIDFVAENPKACKHLHIPLQSGDNAILKAMRRGYTREDFLQLVNYARRKMPDCGITTDIIVGFPGENEKEFQNTVDFVEQVKFSRLHIFPYSRRKGTPAADFPNQVNSKIIKQRNKFLQELNNKLIVEFAQKHLDQEVEILVESKGEGLTSNFIRCYFDDPTNLTGQLTKKRARLSKVSMFPLERTGPCSLNP